VTVQYLVYGDDSEAQVWSEDGKRTFTEWGKVTEDDVHDAHRASYGYPRIKMTFHGVEEDYVMCLGRNEIFVIESEHTPTSTSAPSGLTSAGGKPALGLLGRPPSGSG